MKTKNQDHWILFVLSATVYHCITYFVFGLISSSILNYQDIFNQPIISDYYKQFGSTAIYLGPFIQVIRGILFGLVLLPFRGFLKNEKLGWLWLWLIFIIIGIIGTPSAAPASIEGIIYTKLPIWFHFIGLPEIVFQTMVFSLLVHRRLRSKDYPLPVFLRKAFKAFSSTCISFLGYTFISIIFALSAGVQIDQSNATITILGQFIAPLIFIFLVFMIEKVKINIKHIILYIMSVIAIFLYQEIILGSGGLVYSFVAPILPVLISYMISRKGERTT